MKIWSRFPVFRLIIPFAAGIICCINSISNLKIAIISLAFGIVVAFLFTWKNWATGKYAQRWMAGIPFYFCFWGLGFAFAWFYQTIHFKNHFSEYVTKDKSYFIGELYQPPVTYSKGTKLFTRMLAVKDAGKWRPVRGNLLIYVKDSSHLFACALRDKIVFSGKPQLVQGSHNPNSFDYANYLHSKEIWHQLFTDINQIMVVEENHSFSFYAKATALRDILLLKLKRFLVSEQELGVASALLLGYEDWLDPELEQSYSLAGVLHVLCVSGMHVGLIYGVMAWLLSFMEKKSWLRHFRYFLLILLIWFYALITGFSPSIIRACAMLSFVIAGKWMNKEANVYNLLCCSCLLLFTMDPFLILSAGFQLSFLAVCGIVFLHNLILPLWVPPNKILYRIWELMSISIAAQIATFPLSIFLFHQFPNYFLLGNLAIIPLSTLVMYSGLIFLVTDWIPPVGWLFGTITSWGVAGLNNTVKFLGNLPGSVTTNLYLSGEELLILYLLLIVFFMWLVYKYREIFFFGMLVMIFFMSFKMVQLYRSNEKCELTVFDAGKNNLLTVVTSRKAFIMVSNGVNEQFVKRTAGEYLVANLVKDTIIYHAPDSNLQQFKLNNGVTCVMINGWKKYQIFPSSINSTANSILILSGKIEVDAHSMLQQIKPTQIVISTSCQRKNALKLMAAFKTAGIATHDIAAAGAYQYEIK